MRISDWSSDVCSSDLIDRQLLAGGIEAGRARLHRQQRALAGAIEPDLVQAPWRAGRLQRLGDLERLKGRVAADQRLAQRAGGRAQVLPALIELRGEVVGLQRLAVERGREQVAVWAQAVGDSVEAGVDRKRTRLNSSHKCASG